MLKNFKILLPYVINDEQDILGDKTDEWFTWANNLTDEMFVVRQRPLNPLKTWEEQALCLLTLT